MRSLVFVIKIVLAVSLFAQPIESLAIAAKANSKKTTKKTPKTALQETGSVWDKIRSGMQIPKSFPNQSILVPVQNANNIAQKNAAIKTNVLTPNPTAILHHDDSNRPRLHSVIGRPRLTSDELAKQNAIIQAVDGGRVKSTLRPAKADTVAQAVPVANNKIAKANALLARAELSKQIEDYVNTETPTASARTSTSIEPKAANTNANKPELAPTVQMVKVNSANERINRQLAWYAQHPEYLERVAERARPYIYHIVSQLAVNHLPSELALLPIVESAYQPTAQSPKSAAGLWQFIPSTGLNFDLAQNEQYDERLDIEESTQAAIRYLSILNRHYNGDWLLALAAYNSGEGRVDDAIERNRANGLPTDYWSLQLPTETQDYVPRFLALSSMFANPKVHGLKLPDIKNEPYFVKVKVDRRFAIDYLAHKNLAEIAELSNLSYEQFIRLNPAYLKSTVATNAPFKLLLPASNAEQLNQHLNHVARFLAEPEHTVASNAPLKKRVIVEDSAKPLPVTVISVIHQQPKISSPLFSLDVSKQTTPRLMPQPLLSDFSVQLEPSA